MLNMSYSIRKQTRHETANRVSREPYPRPHGNLVARIPCSGDEHECRRNGGFGDTKQEPNSQQTAVIHACSSQRDDGAPEESRKCQIFGYWQPRDEDVGRVLPEKVAKVEDAGDPAVLLADEVLLNSLVLKHNFEYVSWWGDRQYHQLAQKRTRSTGWSYP